MDVNTTFFHGLVEELDWNGSWRERALILDPYSESRTNKKKKTI